MKAENIEELIKLDEDSLLSLIRGSHYDHYCLPIVELEDGTEYAIALDDKDADDACREYIQISLWAFSPSFIAQETGMPIEIFEALAKADLCEGANEAVMACIEATCGIDSFVESAISWDGRGHFLSFYDGCEVELEGSNAYAYRLS